ncbi:MAG: amino acid permease [Verrucomicrobiota bacterium]|jgi:amino acid transporter/nucleotide-binding universal stress UspA family protein
MEIGTHRPRNLGWARAAGLLYGDLGTSKAYVIGFAFIATGFGSLPIILAVCALTGVVAYNYVIVCRSFPDGGGVYSAARSQSRILAVVGALLLVADLTVTAALSAWSGMSYFGVPKAYVPYATMLLILGFGAINYFGPKHSGSLAVALALPMVLVVILIVGWSLPHLTFANLESSHRAFGQNWVSFVSVILALSGVETIANLTGVLKLDPGSSMEKPQIQKETRKAIWPVAVEVVLGTALLGWAMLSLPKELAPQLKERSEDMVRFVGEQYAAMAWGHYFSHVFGIVAGVVIGLMLFSAVNTAIAALIGLGYMLSRDGEMPRSFARLNPFGVPWVPLAIAVALPILVVALATDINSLASLYAIGVVGAITVNLGSCAINKKLSLAVRDRALLGVTFVFLLAVEFTIAKTKPDALFFVMCILVVGLTLRGYAQKRAGLQSVTVSREVAAAVSPELAADFRPNLNPGQSILVAARGLTPVLRYAMEEARFRQGTLYVLCVKELAVALPGPLANEERPRWQDDPEAAKIMYSMLELGRQNKVSIVPLYAISGDPAATILDLSATLGIDILMLGARHRRTLEQLFKGDVANRVAKDLPENIQLVIYG